MPAYILGDVNISLLNCSSHSESSDYLDLMYTNTFIPLINRPTRVTSTSASLIDHIFTNNLSPDIFKFQGILITDITDHYPIFQIAQLPHKVNPDNLFYFKRKMTEQNFDNFKNSVATYDWSKIEQINLCSKAFSEFHSAMTHLFDTSFPISKIKITYKNRIPWLSEPLKSF